MLKLKMFYNFDLQSLSFKEVLNNTSSVYECVWLFESMSYPKHNFIDNLYQKHIVWRAFIKHKLYFSLFP